MDTPWPGNRWPGYESQVRSRFHAGQLTEAEFHQDLVVAVLLDEGILRDDMTIPPYLRDKNGFPLAPIGEA